MPYLPLACLYGSLSSLVSSWLWPSREIRYDPLLNPDSWLGLNNHSGSAFRRPLLSPLRGSLFIPTPGAYVANGW